MAWADINLDPNIVDHPKLQNLEARVGDAALTHLIRLWCWTSKICPDGDISKYQNADFLERRVMGWKGEPGVLISAMVDLDWIEKKGKGGRRVLIHGWKERNSHVEAFKKKQQGNATKRWQKMLSGGQVVDPQGARTMPDDDLADAKKPSGNASIHPSPPTIPSHPSPPPANGAGPDREGACSPARSIDLTGLLGLHVALFKRQPTKAQKQAYQAAIGEFGAERGRWEYAFSIGRRESARSPEYVITTARNAEPRDWGAVEVKWSPAEREAARLAKVNLQERMEKAQA